MTGKQFLYCSSPVAKNKCLDKWQKKTLVNQVKNSRRMQRMLNYILAFMTYWFPPELSAQVLVPFLDAPINSVDYWKQTTEWFLMITMLTRARSSQVIKYPNKHTCRHPQVCLHIHKQGTELQTYNRMTQKRSGNIYTYICKS